MQRPGELQAALLALQLSASAKEEPRVRPAGTAAARLSMDTVLLHNQRQQGSDGSGASTRGSWEDGRSTSEPQAAARPSMEGSEASAASGAPQAGHQDLPTPFRTSEDDGGAAMAAALAAFGINPAPAAHRPRAEARPHQPRPPRAPRHAAAAGGGLLRGQPGGGARVLWRPRPPLGPLLQRLLPRR